MKNLTNLPEELSLAPTPEVLRQAQSRAGAARYFALQELAQRTARDANLLPLLERELLAARNRELRWRGNTSLAQLVLLALLHTGTLAATATAGRVLAAWDGDERGHFRWLATAEGLAWPETERIAA